MRERWTEEYWSTAMKTGKRAKCAHNVPPKVGSRDPRTYLSVVVIGKDEAGEHKEQSNCQKAVGKEASRINVPAPYSSALIIVWKTIT
jgi:hypothetical protein